MYWWISKLDGLFTDVALIKSIHLQNMAILAICNPVHAHERAEEVKDIQNHSSMSMYDCPLVHQNKRPKGPHIVHLSTMCHLFYRSARAAIFVYTSA